MEQKRLFIIFAILICNLEIFDCNGFTFINPIRFPWAGGEFVPYMGIFLAIALPLDLPDYNVFVSFNLEANYVLPQNQSEFSYPPIISKRSLERKYFYELLEEKLEIHGYSGRECLLRAICETAEYSVLHNGVLGDILHIMLTPSSSLNENEMISEYSKAEEYGRNKKHCKKYNKKCSVSLLGLISVLNNE